MGYNSIYKVTVLNTGFDTPELVSKFDILQDFKEYFKNTCGFDFPLFTTPNTLEPKLISDSQKWTDFMDDVQSFMDKTIYVTSGTILCVERHGEESGDISRTYFKRGAAPQVYEARLEFDDEHVIADFYFERKC